MGAQRNYEDVSPVELLLGHGDVVLLRGGRQLGLLADGLPVEALQVLAELFDALQVGSLRHELVAVQV